MLSIDYPFACLKYIKLKPVLSGHPLLRGRTAQFFSIVSFHILSKRNLYLGPVSVNVIQVSPTAYLSKIHPVLLTDAWIAQFHCTERVNDSLILQNLLETCPSFR